MPMLKSVTNFVMPTLVSVSIPSPPSFVLVALPVVVPPSASARPRPPSPPRRRSPLRFCPSSSPSPPPPCPPPSPPSPASPHAALDDPLPLLDLALHALLRRGFPSLCALLHDQAILSITAVIVAALPSPSPPSTPPTSSPSPSPTAPTTARTDSISRALTCKSLRELEHAHPLLLSDIAGHLWALAQAERTHAAPNHSSSIGKAASYAALALILPAVTFLFVRSPPSAPAQISFN